MALAVLGSVRVLVVPAADDPEAALASEVEVRIARKLLKFWVLLNYGARRISRRILPAQVQPRGPTLDPRQDGLPSR